MRYAWTYIIGMSKQQINLLTANVVHILHMRVTSLVAVVVPRTGKTIKNCLCLFERGENLLQNGIFHFVFTLSQSPEIALQR